MRGIVIAATRLAAKAPAALLEKATFIRWGGTVREYRAGSSTESCIYNVTFPERPTGQIVKSRAMVEKVECAVPVYGTAEAISTDHSHCQEDTKSPNLGTARRTTIMLFSVCIACCMLLGGTLHWVWIYTFSKRLIQPKADHYLNIGWCLF